MSSPEGLVTASDGRAPAAIVCSRVGQVTPMLADPIQLALPFIDPPAGGSIDLAPRIGRRDPRQATPHTPGAGPQPLDLTQPQIRSPVRVLLVEDNSFNRVVVQFLLSPLGVDLDMAEDGAQAVAKMQSGRFDLVLMDIDMPVMDGLAATRAIRNLERESEVGRTPIVMLTAHSSAEHRLASHVAGADDHLAKPVDPDQLFAVIDRVASTGRPLSNA